MNERFEIVVYKHDYTVWFVIDSNNYQHASGIYCALVNKFTTKVQLNKLKRDEIDAA